MYQFFWSLNIGELTKICQNLHMSHHEYALFVKFCVTLLFYDKFTNDYK